MIYKRRGQRGRGKGIKQNWQRFRIGRSAERGRMDSVKEAFPGLVSLALAGCARLRRPSPSRLCLRSSDRETQALFVIKILTSLFLRQQQCRARTNLAIAPWPALTPGSGSIPGFGQLTRSSWWRQRLQGSSNLNEKNNKLRRGNAPRLSGSRLGGGATPATPPYFQATLEGLDAQTRSGRSETELPRRVAA